MITNYKDLDVWNKSITLVEKVYVITKIFPEEEKFALTNQVRRSVISIPSNIAEGWGRKSTKDYIRFLHIALGSLYELETQLIISEKINYIKDEDLQMIVLIIKDLSKMLTGLINNLKKKGNKNESI